MKPSNVGRVMVVILAVTVVLAGPTTTISATSPEHQAQMDDPWNDNWEHRKPLTISERSGQSLSNYPVVTSPIDIGSASPASIRVVNETSGTVLTFGVREQDGEYQLAFKTEISADSTNEHLAVYYGNPDAESVAVPWNEARYNFYDSFDDGDLHSSWEGNRENFIETDGTLQSDGAEWSGGIQREFDQPLEQSQLPIYWETRLISRSTSSTGGDLRRARIENDAGDGHRVTFVRTFQNNDDGVGGSITWDSPDRSKLLRADQFAVNDWLTQDALLKPSGKIEASATNERTGVSGEHVYETNGVYTYTRVEIGGNGGSPGAEWDYVRLRYKVSPEPVVTVGSELDVSGELSTTQGASEPTQTQQPSNEDTEQDIQDSDGDGVIDSEDYAPRDPEVQEKSDLTNTSSSLVPGFGIGITVVALGTLAVLLARLEIE